MMSRNGWSVLREFQAERTSAKSPHQKRTWYVLETGISVWLERAEGQRRMKYRLDCREFEVPLDVMK
jgi:hypothetical protein